MSSITKISGLNELQISLLRMFNRPMSQDEILTLRRLLVSYYSDKLLSEVDAMVIEKGITEADYEKLRTQNQRTPQ